MMPRAFFQQHAVNTHTANVVLDIMDDIYAVTELTPYLVHDNGALWVEVCDTEGDTFRLSDGHGGLPDGVVMVLTYADVTVLRVWPEVSLIGRARTSALVTNVINVLQPIREDVAS